MCSSVLIADDNADVSNLVAEILRGEGFIISELNTVQPTAVRAEVARLEPDVVLLNAADQVSYGASWDSAAWMRQRARPVPVIMFTAHTADLAEARIGRTERSAHAAFAGLLSKPFDLSVLVQTVSRAVKDSPGDTQSSLRGTRRVQSRT